MILKKKKKKVLPLNTIIYTGANNTTCYNKSKIKITIQIIRQTKNLQKCIQNN